MIATHQDAALSWLGAWSVETAAETSCSSVTNASDAIIMEWECEQAWITLELDLVRGVASLNLYEGAELLVADDVPLLRSAIEAMLRWGLSQWRIYAKLEGDHDLLGDHILV